MMAEAVRFELTDSFPSPVFKTGAIDHSATLPRGVFYQCQNRAMQVPPSAASQPRNPLHGVTLEAVLAALVAHYGWADLGQRIPLRCFTSDPSIASSLKFLRKTPWARDKVESLYLFMMREIRRSAAAAQG